MNIIIIIIIIVIIIIIIIIFIIIIIIIIIMIIIIIIIIIIIALIVHNALTHTHTRVCSHTPITHAFIAMKAEGDIRKVNKSVNTLYICLSACGSTLTSIVPDIRTPHENARTKSVRLDGIIINVRHLHSWPRLLFYFLVEFFPFFFFSYRILENDAKIKNNKVS